MLRGQSNNDSKKQAVKETAAENQFQHHPFHTKERLLYHKKEYLCFDLWNELQKYVHLYI